MKTKKAKRSEAYTRKGEYDILTPQQKLKKAIASRGESKRELIKIRREITDIEELNRKLL